MPALFKYEKRPPFNVLFRLAKYSLEGIDHFVELVNETQQKNLTGLEKLAKNIDPDNDSDWLVDDFQELNEFDTLSSEFAIVGLWRCIELFNKDAICIALGPDEAKSVFKHKELKKKLLKLQITEEDVKCSQAANELRCLNNSVKHSQLVSKELASFEPWKNKEEEKLENLGSHYKRLRPLSECYLGSLTEQLNHWWTNIEKKS